MRDGGLRGGVVGNHTRVPQELDASIDPTESIDERTVFSRDTQQRVFRRGIDRGPRELTRAHFDPRMCVGFAHHIVHRVIIKLDRDEAGDDARVHAERTQRCAQSTREVLAMTVARTLQERHDRIFILHARVGRKIGAVSEVGLHPTRECARDFAVVCPANCRITVSLRLGWKVGSCFGAVQHALRDGAHFGNRKAHRALSGGLARRQRFEQRGGRLLIHLQSVTPVTPDTISAHITQEHGRRIERDQSRLGRCHRDRRIEREDHVRGQRTHFDFCDRVIERSLHVATPDLAEVIPHRGAKGVNAGGTTIRTPSLLIGVVVIEHCSAQQQRTHCTMKRARRIFPTHGEEFAPTVIHAITISQLNLIVETGDAVTVARSPSSPRETRKEHENACAQRKDGRGRDDDQSAKLWRGTTPDGDLERQRKARIRGATRARALGAERESPQHRGPHRQRGVHQDQHAKHQLHAFETTGNDEQRRQGQALTIFAVRAMRKQFDHEQPQQELTQHRHRFDEISKHHEVVGGPCQQRNHQQVRHPFR